MNDGALKKGRQFVGRRFLSAHVSVSSVRQGGLGALEGSFGGMLKDAFGAGVMNELPARHQAFGHRNFAPGAEPLRHTGGRDRLSR